MAVVSPETSARLTTDEGSTPPPPLPASPPPPEPQPLSVSSTEFRQISRVIFIVRSRDNRRCRHTAEIRQRRKHRQQFRLGYVHPAGQFRSALRTRGRGNPPSSPRIEPLIQPKVRVNSEQTAAVNRPSGAGFTVMLIALQYAFVNQGGTFLRERPLGEFIADVGLRGDNLVCRVRLTDINADDPVSINVTAGVLFFN